MILSLRGSIATATIHPAALQTGDYLSEFNLSDGRVHNDGATKR